jgi:hypothetical protein
MERLRRVDRPLPLRIGFLGFSGRTTIAPAAAILAPVNLRRRITITGSQRFMDVFLPF